MGQSTISWAREFLGEKFVVGAQHELSDRRLGANPNHFAALRRRESGKGRGHKRE